MTVKEIFYNNHKIAIWYILIQSNGSLYPPGPPVSEPVDEYEDDLDYESMVKLVNRWFNFLDIIEFVTISRISIKSLKFEYFHFIFDIFFIPF